jgi:hypothetical protein
LCQALADGERSNTYQGGSPSTASSKPQHMGSFNLDECHDGCMQALLQDFSTPSRLCALASAAATDQNYMEPQ